jgi:hypothetical protein
VADRPPPRAVAWLLAVLDGLRPAQRRGPREIFQLRFIAGGALLGLSVAAVSLVQVLLAGQTVTAMMLGVFAVSVGGLLLGIRLGVAVPTLSLGALAVVALFLVAACLAPPELKPEQLSWLVILPLVALVLVGPRAATGDAPPSRRPVTLAALAAIALGVAIVLAHAHGLSFGEVAPVRSPGGQIAEFVQLVVSVGALLWLYDLALRSNEEEFRTLRRLLSVCAWCKEIRDGEDGWISLERYLAKHDTPSLSHGICPSCARRQFPDE